MSKDAVDDYNESVWLSLGHPAFENEFLANLEDVEWWDINEESNASS